MDNINISEWNGSVDTFYRTNLNNYLSINQFVSNWNATNNSFAEPIDLKLNTINYNSIDRLAYHQFINNAKKLVEILPKLVDDYRVTDYNFECKPPSIPVGIDFNQELINNFWGWVRTCFNWIIGQLNAVSE